MIPICHLSFKLTFTCTCFRTVFFILIHVVLYTFLYFSDEFNLDQIILIFLIIFSYLRRMCAFM